MRTRLLVLLLAPLMLAADNPPAAAPSGPILPLDPHAFDGVSVAEHAVDVADYTLVARLDADLHTVHGEGTIEFHNTSEKPVEELWLHLYLNAFKNDKSLFARGPSLRISGGVRDYGSVDVKRLALRDGEAVSELRVETKTQEGSDDETDARVPLPREVLPGESITLEVSFDDKLPTVLERTGYEGSFHFAGQWFPKLARLEADGTWAHFPFHHLSEFYADFGSYDVTLDVPASYVIGATGPLAEEPRIEGGRRIERHVQQDIHDFAWTAWDKWQKETTSVGGVAIAMLYPPGYRVVAQRELAAVRFTLPYYEALYGPYPYKVLTVVHPPDAAEGAAGMEYPTLITTGAAPWFGPPGVFVAEYVTIHELGHQWFYGLVATDEHAWPFLDEGLNSYAQVGALRGLRGGPGSIVDLVGLKVDIGAVQAVWSNHSALLAKVAQPAPAFVNGREYADLVYSRTAAIMETLARVYGEDKVALGLGRYTRAFRFLHPGPEDFLRAMGEALGEPAEDALRAALFDKGWVDYAVEAVSSRARTTAGGIFDKDGKRETAAAQRSGDYEGTVLVSRRGTLSFPVEIELTFEDGTTERKSWDGAGDHTRITVIGAKRLKAAVVDPDHAVLIDPNLANNFGSAAEYGGASATRTFERSLYWGQLLMQAVSP